MFRGHFDDTNRILAFKYHNHSNSVHVLGNIRYQCICSLVD
jgi:hypothetical protein